MKGKAESESGQPFTATVTSRTILFKVIIGMQSIPTSTSPSNRGSRRQPQPDPPSTSDLVQNSYRQASPTPFPQYDYLSPSSTNQHDFSPPTFQRQRAISSYALDSGTLKFPEPQLYRASSGKATYRPLTPPNRDYRSDQGISPRPSPAPPPALPPRNFIANPEINDAQPLTQHVAPETPLDTSKPRYQPVLTTICT
ncbi:hypothetical protein H4582DRAFT_1565649 [Lactarius indigo]|nr:hypothetical protein H4582DRAFT_1565649 [Lactarius indigo]